VREGVAEGGKGVEVLVRVGETAVEVLVGVGVSVKVGGTGVEVRVSIAVAVKVGGTGVEVKVSVAVAVKVGGTGVEVKVSVAVAKGPAGQGPWATEADEKVNWSRCGPPSPFPTWGTKRKWLFPTDIGRTAVAKAQLSKAPVGGKVRTTWPPGVGPKRSNTIGRDAIEPLE